MSILVPKLVPYTETANIQGMCGTVQYTDQLSWGFSPLDALEDICFWISNERIGAWMFPHLLPYSSEG